MEMTNRSLPNYEVLALRFAHADGRAPQTNFLMDEHDLPGGMTFYIWAIRDRETGRVIVVDTGFSEEAAQKRRRGFLHQPGDLLRAAGIDTEKVEDVVITHLHWDHSGHTAATPNARFHIQDQEMSYATGRCMCHPFFRNANMLTDVLDLVRLVYGERVIFHDGDEEIAPGVTLHLVGGHTAGMQVVRVHTERGWIVLASDASHYWRSVQGQNPFPKVLDIGKTIEGFRLLKRLADSEDHIIPGHDPEVMLRFPRYENHADIVRVDLPPIN
jgi:glyoxylase-like metal-dependent hydrolase (beta-lactamase superfamily II)